MYILEIMMKSFKICNIFGVHDFSPIFFRRWSQYYFIWLDIVWRELQKQYIFMQWFTNLTSKLKHQEKGQKLRKKKKEFLPMISNTFYNSILPELYYTALHCTVLAVPCTPHPFTMWLCQRVAVAANAKIMFEPFT